MDSLRNAFQGLPDPTGRMESEFLVFEILMWPSLGSAAPLLPLLLFPWAPPPSSPTGRAGLGQQQQLAQLSCPLLEPLCQLWS